MNLTYTYQATLGQVGSGSTAGNAGPLTSTTGTIGGTAESASYAYDLLGRLTTSNQTSNGSGAQRRFAYDRWGNRTAMWDAVSGGNQIQSLVVQQSGGAPTNRLTSVTTSGVTANYTYDAAGNVTNDGSHVYQYDAENRIVSVDSGAAATYAYDMSNQRYKKVTGGATTHYVWKGSQVIAEHNGSTGASIADYIYADSRMVARTSGLLTQYYLSDRLSVRMTLNSIGNVLGRQAHLPFGEDFAESGSQEKHHFTSYERDAETGTDHPLSRQYAQSVGRFNGVDPVRGSCTNPQSLNRYAYVRNDPANLVDPSGREAVDPNGLGCTLGNCTSNVSAGPVTIDPQAAAGAAYVMEYWRIHPRLTEFELRSGQRNGPEPITLNPCEKKLAVTSSGVTYWPAVLDAWRRAENWEREATNGQGSDDDWTNAVKHCIWSCQMTKNASYDEAVKWGDAHECDDQGNPTDDGSNSPNARSSRMDQHNNEAGRFYGSKFPKQDCKDNCKTDTYGRLQTSP